MNDKVAGGIVGTSLSAVGTATQTNQVLQTISLILTIVGTIIIIAMAILNWWKKSKEDGKLSKEEINEGIDIIKNGVDSIYDNIEDFNDKQKGEKK